MPRISRFGSASIKKRGKSSIGANIDVASIEAPPQAKTQHHSRKSSRYWTVDVQDAAGVTKIAQLRLKDLWALPNGMRVMLPLDEYNQPIGEAAGLLGQALGELGFDFAAFPIGYDSWSAIPNDYKEKVYNGTLKEKFILDDDLVKKTILKRLGGKWKDNRTHVFHRCYNPEISKEENLMSPPLGISREEWTRFVEYRLRPKTMKMCKRNAKNREKQVVVHTGGSKTLARKRKEMELETGDHVSRGMVFVATHTKTDGSFQNDATKTICEKILHIESRGSCSHVIAPNDSLGQVFGEEHSGWVRGMGLGPCPSQVFGLKSQRSSGEGSSFLAPNDQMKQEIAELRANLEKETQKRREFENSITLILQELAASLKRMNDREREEPSSEATYRTENGNTIDPSSNSLTLCMEGTSKSTSQPQKEKPNPVNLDSERPFLDLQKKISDLVRILANETGASEPSYYCGHH